VSKKKIYEVALWRTESATVKIKAASEEEAENVAYEMELDENLEWEHEDLEAIVEGVYELEDDE
jgi:hypothetical protein